MQVDVTTRMGALQAATATGLPILDRMLSGGLRAATPVLDETEIVARLATRALHREHPDSRVSYGALWTGQAWQDKASQGAVSAAVETVVKKVGALLHVHRTEPFEPTATFGGITTGLLGRHERVVVVIDGIEALSASLGGDEARAAQANSSLENRVCAVALELRRIAESGAAILVTTQSRHLDLVAPAATVSAELRGVEGSTSGKNERLLALGARPLELVVRKNHTGPTGIVPLRFIAGAATFEERAP
jgi:hypothetical protein